MTDGFSKNSRSPDQQPKVQRGLRVQGLGFRVEGSGFRVLWLRVYCLGHRVRAH